MAAAAASPMGEVADVVNFLKLDSNPVIRGATVEFLLGVSSSPHDGLAFYTANRALIQPIMAVAGDGRFADVAQQAFKVAINLSAMDDKDIERELMEAGAVKVAVAAVVDPGCSYADQAAALLGNMTRAEAGAQTVLDCKVDGPLGVIATIADIFCRGPAFNKHAKFHDLGSVLFNVTQIDEARSQIMLRAGEGCVFQRLLPFTAFADSKTRRGGVVGAIRNCCYKSTDREWLLGDEVDILPHLLMPLIGPEELDEDDMDGMPDDLQYMPPDKQREADPTIRRHLLEALQHLCSTKENRAILREKKVYPVLKHYHLWEANEAIRDVCEDVVAYLIGDEATSDDEGADDVNGDAAAAAEADDEKRLFHVGAPEGTTVKWRPDYGPVDLGTAGGAAPAANSDDDTADDTK